MKTDFPRLTFTLKRIIVRFASSDNQLISRKPFFGAAEVFSRLQNISRIEWRFPSNNREISLKRKNFSPIHPNLVIGQQIFMERLVAAFKGDEK